MKADGHETADGKIVGFIDLLGTKDSAKISESRFLNSIQTFLFALATESKRLTVPAKFQYLSDSAFFELELNGESMEFLRHLRRSLFSSRIYFKCALIKAQLKPRNVDRKLLNEVASAQTRVKGGIILSDRDAKQFSGFYFGGETIRAYILQEQFKGIGYYVDEALAKALPPTDIVQSTFFSDDKMLSTKSFWDVSFSDKFEVASFPKYLLDSPEQADLANDNTWQDSRFYVNEFLRGMEIASLKKSTFARYYIPTLTSMARSSDYSSMIVKGDRLLAMPLLYSEIVLEKVLSRRRIPSIGAFHLMCAILDSSVKRQLTLVEDAEKASSKFRRSSRDAPLKSGDQDNEVIRLICKQFAEAPGFKQKLHSSSSSFLSDRVKDIFLDSTTV